MSASVMILVEVRREVEYALAHGALLPAVNCFPTEPVWKIDRGATGTSSSTFASPYPLALMSRPPFP